MAEDKLKEGDVGGAVCTADSCIGDFAPEHVCSVVTDITPTRKKIDEFFDKMEANLKAIKEGKEPEQIQYEKFPSSKPDVYTKDDNKYIRKFDYGGTIRYPGDEEYAKLKSDWTEKRKAIHDKKINTTSFETYPNRTHRLGGPNLYSTYDDGREDDFLAWYEDHKKEQNKPALNESSLNEGKFKDKVIPTLIGIGATAGIAAPLTGLAIHQNKSFDRQVDNLGLELSDKANQPDGASCFVNAIKDFKYDGKISKEYGMDIDGLCDYLYDYSQQHFSVTGDGLDISYEDCGDYYLISYEGEYIAHVGRPTASVSTKCHAEDSFKISKDYFGTQFILDEATVTQALKERKNERIFRRYKC